MPIAGYMSLCKERAPIISSRDKGGSQTHIAYNRGSSFVTHYQVDGVIIKSGNKCDFLLINEDKKNSLPHRIERLRFKLGCHAIAGNRTNIVRATCTVSTIAI